MTKLRDVLHKLAYDAVQAKENARNTKELEDNINGLINEVIEVIRSRIIG